MKFENRYARNGFITSDEQSSLLSKTAAVIGLGGLGGYAVEELARIGVGHLIISDGDTFSETNLNRQLFCTEQNIGKFKSDEAKKRIAIINSEVGIIQFAKCPDKTSLKNALNGADIVLDCVDSIPTRLDLEDVCEELDIPMVHAAINGWCGQVCSVFPGDRIMHRIFTDTVRADTVGNSAFTAAVTASIQVSEAVKVLLGKKNILRNRLMSIDLLNNEFQEIPLK